MKNRDELPDLMVEDDLCSECADEERAGQAAAPTGEG